MNSRGSGRPRGSSRRRRQLPPRCTSLRMARPRRWSPRSRKRPVVICSSEDSSGSSRASGEGPDTCRRRSLPLENDFSKPKENKKEEISRLKNSAR